MATDYDSRRLASSQEIQGNILAPFRCDHQAFLFLSFRQDQAGARRWLDQAAGRMSSTDDVCNNRGESYLGVGLTATGLVLLHPEVAPDLAQFEAFWSGPLGTRLDDSGALTTTAALLSDIDASDPRCWVVGGPDRPPVDALLTVAAPTDEALDSAVGVEVQYATERGLDVVRVETGRVLRDTDDGPSIDHFGFADGISQPGVRGYSEVADIDGRLEDAQRPGSPIIATGEFILGYPGERRPPSRTARPAPAPWMADGSFQVFRRLRQDVAGWRQKMESLSGSGNSRADIEAAAIGRRPDGRPLDPSHGSGTLNSFTYERDPHGWYTPLFAHIRKMNPRDDKVFRDRSHKLLRRGVPFGARFDTETPDNVERGLLFSAYMASIEDQFEFLQRRWANDPEFPTSTLSRFQQSAGKGGKVAGLDPVVGDDATVARRRFGKRVSRDIPPVALGGFVTTTGAVYAFAPSIGALRQLAAATRL
jgi:Dyp-type peroxidase family